MKRVLIQIDTDPLYSSFDAIAAVDAGADVVLGYGGVTPENVRDIAYGAIFTRGGEELRNTAIWVGGRNVALGEQILSTIQKTFFGGFRVSVMLDCNGCNTTAAAAVAKITRAVDVRGQKVVLVGGAGPVGQRVAALFAREGAHVTITTIRQDWLDGALRHVEERFGVRVEGRLVPNEDVAAWREALAGTRVALGAAAAGVRLLPLAAWQDNPTLEVVADLNAAPPSGIEGIELADDGAVRHGKRSFGPIGIGNFKMKVHRAAVAALFERKDQVLEAEAVYAIARGVS